MDYTDEILDHDLEKKYSKKSLMKIKHVLILFIIGWIVFQAGTLFKIMSWSGGSELLLSGTILKVFSGLLGIIKLMTIREITSFLNR